MLRDNHENNPASYNHRQTIITTMIQAIVGTISIRTQLGNHQLYHHHHHYDRQMIKSPAGIWCVPVA